MRWGSAFMRAPQNSLPELRPKAGTGRDVYVYFMSDAWIVDPRRSAFTRAGKGAFAGTRPDDLLAALFAELLAAHPGTSEALDDVVVGCAYPEAEQGRNPARAA